eukprot:1065092-Rhodomonas_salina.1
MRRLDQAKRENGEKGGVCGQHRFRDEADTPTLVPQPVRQYRAKRSARVGRYTKRSTTHCTSVPCAMPVPGIA